MKKITLIGLSVVIVLISGCAEKECKVKEDCPDKNCFTKDCIDYNCSYSQIIPCCGNEKCESTESYETCATDCPNCDDKNDCTTDSYDFHEQKCINEPIAPCCGNGICDKDVEAYSNCPADCPNCDDNNECTADSYDYHGQKCLNAPIPNVICCGNGVCEIGETYETCTKDCPNCDDENECTEDSYEYHEEKCIHEPIIPCCGNNICDEETAETYSSCPIDCPDCNDNNKITADSFNYETRECGNMIDLKIFPEPFVVNGVYDSSNAFVFGNCGAKEQSAGMDVIDKMFLEESTTSTAGTVSQVIGSDILAEPEKRHNHNLIFVGGPCCNPLVEDIFGIGCEDWIEGKEDESFIILTKNGEDKVALLVAGFTSDDTVATAEVLANYKDYDLTGTNFLLKE